MLQKHFVYIKIGTPFISFFMEFALFGIPGGQSNSKIQEENRVRIVKNPTQSRYGQIELNLEKDLVK
jgi:hypothetical protein